VNHDVIPSVVYTMAKRSAGVRPQPKRQAKEHGEVKIG